MQEKVWENPEVKILDIKRDTKEQYKCKPPHGSGKPHNPPPPPKPPKPPKPPHKPPHN